MPWCTLAEAASECGCSVRSIQRRISAGTFTAKKDGGRVLVDLPATERQPVRRLADVAVANTVQMQAVSDGFRDSLAKATDACVRAEQDARTARRTAVAAISWAMALTTAAAVVSYVGVTHHRDALDVARDDLDAAGAAHRTEVAAQANDHQDVILELTGQVHRANGLAEGRASELSRAGERLDAAVQQRDESAANAKRLEAQARGERVDGTPILLSARP